MVAFSPGSRSRFWKVRWTTKDFHARARRERQGVLGGEPSFRGLRRGQRDRTAGVLWGDDDDQTDDLGDDEDLAVT